MDKRNTFKDLDQLLGILVKIKDQKEKASFIIDDKGLARIEGEITGIESKNAIGDTIIAVHDTTVVLDEVIAVNGIFRADYSEC